MKYFLFFVYLAAYWVVPLAAVIVIILSVFAVVTGNRRIWSYVRWALLIMLIALALLGLGFLESIL